MIKVTCTNVVHNGAEFKVVWYLMDNESHVCRLLLGSGHLLIFYLDSSNIL